MKAHHSKQTILLVIFIGACLGTDYLEITEKQLEFVEKQALQFLPFLVDDLDDQLAIPKMKNLLKKYYNYESKQSKLNNILLEYINLELKDFTDEHWEALEQTINRGYDEIVESYSYSLDSVTTLLNRVKPRYIESFKGSIKNSNYQGMDADMNYDFNFYDLSLIYLKNLKSKNTIDKNQYS